VPIDLSVFPELNSHAFYCYFPLCITTLFPSSFLCLKYENKLHVIRGNIAGVDVNLICCQWQAATHDELSEGRLKTMSLFSDFQQPLEGEEC
jgi:hypothetical protein